MVASRSSRLNLATFYGVIFLLAFLIRIVCVRFPRNLDEGCLLSFLSDEFPFPSALLK